MAAPKTVLTYPLNGSSKDFAIPFEYLARKFVVVTLMGATRRPLVLNSEYRFTTKKQITTTTAWGPAQGFELIEIRRVTSATERLVDFSDGSILRAYDLNTAQIQSLHIAEEARDLTADTIGVNNEGNLDARGRRIVNLADAVNPGDAVNLRQNQQWAGSALNQANRSQQEADRAQQEANRATERAGAANNSAISASGDAGRAQQFAGQAKQSEVNAGGAAGAAGASAQSAAESNQKASVSAQGAVDHYNKAVTEANRATAEANRAKAEADKLGNMNGFAGVIEWVNADARSVQFAGNVGARSHLIVRGDSDAHVLFTKVDGTDALRWTRNSGRQMLLVDDARGIVRATFQTDGSLDIPADIRTRANLHAGSGVVGVKAASPTANSHVWHYHSDGSSRGVLYMDNASNYHVQLAGREHVIFYQAGHTGFNGRITAPDMVSATNVFAGNGSSWLAPDGNIGGPAWRENNLYSHVEVRASVFVSALSIKKPPGWRRIVCSWHLDITLKRASGL
ncbi:phage tail fiber domain-containing protein [Pseudomonas chlororaphis]|uniref:phage tail fiber domain-containing protein n=1 Tax=Pseudomonas chlororaphis TaxID=587753 RepID=UPI0006A5A8E9|nr:phage tail fiber protein [Pseudomonas chlororaphis]